MAGRALRYKKANNCFRHFAKGVLPAMFGRFFLDDFIIDCEMRPGTMAPGAAYGLIFRAADIQNNAINSYYVLLFDPNANSIALSCLDRGNWVYNERRDMPSSLSLRMGTPQITLEAIGSRRSGPVDLAIQRRLSETEAESVIHGSGHGEQNARRDHTQYAQGMPCH